MSLNFKSKDFVHLHLHTDYSLLQSAIQLKPLAKRLTEMEMKACAITDFGNLYGAISFYNQMKAAAIHPILGYEAHLTFGSRHDRDARLEVGERPFYHLVLLAKNRAGFSNLTYLASKAFTEGLHHKPRIDLELLAERCDGLIALSAGGKGAINHFLRNDNYEKALANTILFKDLFGNENFYIEIESPNSAVEEKIQNDLRSLSKQTGLPLVASSEAHYLTPEDALAHEILMCIGEGKTIHDSTRSQMNGANFYVRSAEEMWERFGDDLPEALTNTLKIAEACQVHFPKGDNLTLPNFPIPADSGCATTDEYFERVVKEGFEMRKKSVWNPQQIEGKLKYDLNNYSDRIEREIETIRNMGFPGYFLIVWEFIRYAKEKNIPVGPGRGSAAGSLVAYCLEITDVDPLQYDLLFERFLNPERVSMPDIDIDFCVRGRGEVINHVTEVYGRDSVCQIITFGTMASKAAIKDVGRALSMPLGEVEKVAKLIPPPVRGRNISINQALEQVAELKQAMDSNAEVKKLVDLARRLEGCARHTSVHAAGVVISPKPLHDLVPVSLSGKNELTSQYPMGDLEKVGMLKMDFLALTTLTMVSDCLISLKQKTGVEVDWSRVPLDDEKTMELFGEGRTEAIFQFESSGMQEICRRLKPKELEDLSALNALYRPGPLDGGMVDDFIARHRGEKKVQFIVPQMKDILSNTFGILVYQEQIMQIAQQLGGYSLGEADLMRRAMGKKKREEMAVHEEKFVKGAVERSIKREKASEIFHLMAQFADYGFNRSHSVAYAYLAFQTAYLKAHYPSHFYASVLTSEADDTTKVYKYTNELRSLGLQLLPPDINESDSDFTPLEIAVRFGLTAIKGIGAASIQAIIEARQQGNFTSLFDFTSRVSQGSVNRRALESLITAGAFDSLMPADSTINKWRARLFASINAALTNGQKLWNDKLSGQNALFGAGSNQQSDYFGELPEVPAWTSTEIANFEKTSVGFYLSTHPMDYYEKTLIDLKIQNIADYDDIQPGEKITLSGIVNNLSVKYSKKGNRFCIFRLEDRSGGVKCLGWSEIYNKHSESIKNDELLIIMGKVESVEGQEITLILEDVKKLADAVPQKAQRLAVKLQKDNLNEAYFDNLTGIFNKNRGNCEVVLDFELGEGILIKIQSQALRIQGTSRMEKELNDLKCQVEWIL